MKFGLCADPFRSDPSSSFKYAHVITRSATAQLTIFTCCGSRIELVVEIESTQVVPLDTLLLPRSSARRYRLCADCVLLVGSAFVDESTLTGVLCCAVL